MLAVAAVVDPGDDTRTGYSIDWGDGTSLVNFTPAQWLAAAGSVGHIYADGASTPTITVSATDEDGTFVLGTKALSVNNVAPTLTLTGAADTNEGASYILNIAGADVAGTADPLTYSIDWGDGSAVQVVSAAVLLAASGDVTHTFADDEDGPTNATLRTIGVTVNDGDGGVTVQSHGVTVHNVAPVALVSGADSTTAGSLFVLDVGAVADPGVDTRVAYTIDWGDGATTNLDPVQWAAALGSFSHTFGSGNPSSNIVVSTTDEDGTFVLGGKLVSIESAEKTVRLGDAPLRESGLGKEWSVAWTQPGVSIEHKADYTSAFEAWTATRFTGALTQLLAGNDIYAGDLGVSGQSEATSTVRQEIDGKEGLRFNLQEKANGLTLFLSRLFAQDDGGDLFEAGRVRLLDNAGVVVGETVFVAGDASGDKQIHLTVAGGFTAVEINAGVYDGANFVFGGYANADGSFGSAISTDQGGRKHGSDFMLDSVEFQIPIIGVPQPDIG